MRFLLTQELGRLATWLRILGYDTLYVREDKLSSVVIQALKDDRVILTRNRRLFKTGGVKVVVFQKERIREQLAEFFQRFQMRLEPGQMFSRCILCNTRLEPIAKEKVKGRVPAYVFATQTGFTTCAQCSRVYWPGTHWGNVEKVLQEIGA